MIYSLVTPWRGNVSVSKLIACDTLYFYTSAIHILVLSLLLDMLTTELHFAHFKIHI